MLPVLQDRRSWLKSLFFGPRGTPSLVVVFLRGGADGLNMVVPTFDREYYKLRPTLAIKDTLPLDDRFAFHPNFKPLLPYFQDKRLAIVHAVGSNDESRSHFEAQDLMERAGRPEEGVGGGWLARHLRTLSGSRGAIASVAIGPTLPESLRGAPSACAMESIEQMGLNVTSATFTNALKVMYEADQTSVGKQGLDTLTMIERVNSIKNQAKPEGYPETHFGRSLAEVGRLLKADLGLEVACLDVGGWDTHFTQAALLGGLIEELAGGLAAFAKDLGNRLERTTIVCMTEFGRRAYENASLGTDHGRASVMFVLGGAVRGGRVIAQWPSLAGNALQGPGDLDVTIDYRDVLAEVLEKGFGNRHQDKIFPGTKLTDRGLF